jgi:hypothetical protein
MATWYNMHVRDRHPGHPPDQSVETMADHDSGGMSESSLAGLDPAAAGIVIYAIGKGQPLRTGRPASHRPPTTAADMAHA